MSLENTFLLGKGYDDYIVQYMPLKVAVKNARRRL
jgi:hypothetical protein